MLGIFKADNLVARLCKWVALCKFIITIPVGYLVGESYSYRGNVNSGIAISIWVGGFLSGLLFLAIGEIINLLDDILKN